MAPGTITLYIAASVDGYIATPGGGVAWLDDFTGDEGVTQAYEAFFEDIDCLLMGATTYEQVLGFGEWPYGDRPTYVVTSRDLPLAAETVTLHDGPVEALVDRVTKEHDHGWLVGGAQLAGAMLDAGDIDALRLSVIPTLLGDGIRLFDEGEPRGLDLLETTAFDNGIVELHYRVE